MTGQCSWSQSAQYPLYTLKTCLVMLESSIFAADEGDSSSDSSSEDGEGGEESKMPFAEEQSCLLLRYMLQCLTKCFLYDKAHFLTKERFDSIMPALVDQVRQTLN